MIFQYRLRQSIAKIWHEISVIDAIRDTRPPGVDKFNLEFQRARWHLVQALEIYKRLEEQPEKPTGQNSDISNQAPP